MKQTLYKGFWKKRKEASLFRYVDDVLPLTICKLCDFADRIYHIELAIKDAIDTAMSALYLHF
jgi:hypothetical protein